MHLTCKAAFTSGCCQAQLLIIILRWFHQSVTRHTQQAEVSYHHHASARDSSSSTCAQHGRREKGILATNLWPPLISQPEFTSHKTIRKISPYRRSVLCMQNDREARQWALETPVLFEAKQILRWHHVQGEHIIYWTLILQESKRAKWCLKWNNKSIKIHSILLQ